MGTPDAPSDVEIAAVTALAADVFTRVRLTVYPNWIRTQAATAQIFATGPVVGITSAENSADKINATYDMMCSVVQVPGFVTGPRTGAGGAGGTAGVWDGGCGSGISSWYLDPREGVRVNQCNAQRTAHWAPQLS